MARAARYSPNSEQRDAALLQAVAQRLSRWAEVQTVGEDDGSLPRADVYVSMARSGPMLDALRQAERRGALVLNSSRGVRLACRRWQLRALLAGHGVPLPPDEGSAGYWVKRADEPSQTALDVQYAGSREQADRIVAHMRARGVGRTVVEAHVAGDVVKFYGVAGTGFFRCYYPADDGQTKFGDELRFGPPRHHAFCLGLMRQTAARAARLARLAIYGGDCVVRADGTFVLIDLNDFPSFSRCRDEAAEAIARCVRMQTER